MIIAACNVSLTSLETQSPTEEGTRNYKMEIEGESLQSSCQEALPAWETAMTLLQGCLGSHTWASPSSLREATRALTQAFGHLPLVGNMGFSASTSSTVGFPKGVSGVTAWGGFSHRLENLGPHTCEEPNR